MLDQINLETRLTNLEKMVGDLQAQVNKKENTENWLQNLVSSISDESAFLEALEYGRAFRESDRPLEDWTVITNLS
jgi:hypothetical protein